MLDDPWVLARLRRLTYGLHWGAEGLLLFLRLAGEHGSSSNKDRGTLLWTSRTRDNQICLTEESRAKKMVSEFSSLQNYWTSVAYRRCTLSIDLSPLPLPAHSLQGAPHLRMINTKYNYTSNKAAVILTISLMQIQSYMKWERYIVAFEFIKCFMSQSEEIDCFFNCKTSFIFKLKCCHLLMEWIILSVDIDNIRITFHSPLTSFLEFS